MRITSRMTVIGLVSGAAVAIGSLALAVPASANESATATVTTDASTVPTQPTLESAPPQESAPQTSEQSSSKWEGGAARDMDSGMWRATVTRDGTTLLLGQYGTEKEARKAARKAARELNGVMDGPGCDPPFVLC